MSPRRPPIRVVVVDDHPVTRLGLKAVLDADPRLEVVGQAATANEGVALFLRERPDVILLDLALPDASGLEALAEIRREAPDARALIVTGAEGEEHAYRAVTAGVNGYLPKSTPPPELVAAVCAIAGGQTVIAPELAAQVAARSDQPDLTPRELEVLRLIVEGRSNAEIGLALGMGTGTARTHVSNILDKLGAGDRTEAATVALRRGIL